VPLDAAAAQSTRAANNMYEKIFILNAQLRDESNDLKPYQHLRDRTAISLGDVLLSRGKSDVASWEVAQATTQCWQRWDVRVVRRMQEGTAGWTVVQVVTDSIELVLVLVLLRVACCVLRVACCVLRVACCVLRVATVACWLTVHCDDSTSTSTGTGSAVLQY
jgi:hypothetical protein